MSIKKLLLPILLTPCLAFAQAPTQESVLDPMTIETNREASSHVLAKALQEPNTEKRYLAVKGFIEHYGKWVTLDGDNISPRVYITSYLLQTNQAEIASALLKNGEVDGWLAYRFLDGVANDFVFALQGGHISYLNALFKHAPKGLNTPLPVQLDGEPVPPLSLLATREYMEKPFYETVLLSMLNLGANPHQKMSTGLTPMVVASSSNNMRFVRIVQTHSSGQNRTEKGLLSNSPLTSSELIEMQAIADTLIEKSAAEKAKYKYDKLLSLWVQMILKGYNTVADLLYEELLKRPQFKIDDVSSGGMNALMATAMSTLYGGNVEYAARLIERGADPHQIHTIKSQEAGDIKVGYIQLALHKDNFKIVALMMKSGVNFVSLPDEPKVLMLSEAMAQKAYISAAMLKEALMTAVSSQEKKG